MARGWRAGGPNIYGRCFVDRPPGRVALYRVAFLTGWEPSIRVLATGFAVLTLSGAAFRGRAPHRRHLAARRRSPGDTAAVLYGNASVQEASGMPSPYAQLWTLPMRTLDPPLVELRALLRGPRAPLRDGVGTLPPERC
ncbi:MAG: hypothetical protein ABI776_09190 [Nocardioidaceae bacterium]